LLQDGKSQMLNIPKIFAGFLVSLVLVFASSTGGFSQNTSGFEAISGSRAQAEVIRRFPEIGVPGSDSNKRFLSAVEEARQTRPTLFKSDDWPLQIALENESFKSLASSLQSKDSRLIAKHSIEFKSIDKNIEREVNMLGLKLQDVNAEQERIQQSGPSIQASANKLIKSAVLNENYVSPFNPNDTSSRSKAEQQRKQAQELTSTFKEKSDRILSEKETLLDQISRIAPTEVVSGGQSQSGRPSSPRAAGDLFVGLDNEKFMIGLRGPEVHGLRLGMTYEDFYKVISASYPSSMQVGFYRGLDRSIPVGDLINKHAYRVQPVGFIANKEDAKFGASLYPKNSDSKSIGLASTTFIAAGPVKSIIYFSLERPLLQALFKFGSMSFDEFVQKFIDNYGVPKLKGTTSGGKHLLSYVSPNGWKIMFEGYDSFGITTVHFMAVLTEDEQGFGK